MNQVSREIDFKPGVHLAPILRESWWIRDSAHDSICLAYAIECNCRNPGATLKFGPNLNLITNEWREYFSGVPRIWRSNGGRLKGLNEVGIERKMGGSLKKRRA